MPTITRGNPILGGEVARLFREVERAKSPAHKKSSKYCADCPTRENFKKIIDAAGTLVVGANMALQVDGKF